MIFYIVLPTYYSTQKVDSDMKKNMLAHPCNYPCFYLKRCVFSLGKTFDN